MLKEINVNEIAGNPFKKIGSDWLLVTAGTKESFNTMTAAWAAMGVLWNKNVCFAFIRPQRYTYEFTEKYDNFTFSFFPEKYRDALKICGTKSGRDTDKIIEAGLTPNETPAGEIFFEESELIIECKKIYIHDLDPKFFLDPSIESNYNNDYHRMYIGEITKVYKNV